MLAGCSFSSRHQMSTAQRFDILPCGFSKRGNRGDGAAPRVAGDARSGTTCSFRTHPAPPVTQAVSWGAKPEPGDNGGGVWERSRAVKRSHDDDAVEEYGPIVRAKRTRMGGDGDEVWFHQSIAGTMQATAAGEGEEAEEEKVFLVPSAAAFPHGMAAAGPSLAAAKKEEYSKSPSDSSSSSSGTDGGSSAMLPPPPPEFDARNGVPAPGQAEQEALELVRALIACADSITTRNHEAANYYLARLGEMASPAGPTPMHRVAAYFTEALALRVVHQWPLMFDISPPRDLTDDAFGGDDDAMALRVLNAVTPIPRFLHFTLNERLLRAFEGHERVHVIDFDIKQGLQWPGLLQSLATRAVPPAHVRITGVGESRQELQETGARLARVAAALGLAFEFHAVVDRLEDVRLWMLHVKRGESVAVNCVLTMHRLLRDDSGAALADFLGLARSTGAAILLLGEHEGGGLNSGRWEARFARALRYYAAAFDAVDAAGLPDASPARARAEEMFAREIRNAVAFEGTERFERHESFAGWRRLMEDGGVFKNAGIGDREAMQGRMIARMFGGPDKYSVQAQGDGEGLTLRWMDQPLYTVTAWTPAGDGDGDGAGGSTVSASTTASHSQQS
ncbi:protein DWARF AND LOW-TILLERING [Oryza brachyantha]|uniref:protein DWARF AND LOW-TILLERING n=1 Tax=Oryza brachyantha TaxID=4533 RepID=UPI001ADA3367|nr:protein DWARF AND LOW-TILLERING [Oryza brachyantha]